MATIAAQLYHPAWTVDVELEIDLSGKMPVDRPAVGRTEHGAAVDDAQVRSLFTNLKAER